MAFHSRSKLNEDTSPVAEPLLGQLLRTSPPEAVEIAKDLPEPQRARLAMFCYNKRHLYALGLMIASTCNRSALVKVGGSVGDAIYHQSRDLDKTFSAEIHPPGSRPRKQISLARIKT
jgi:hypothetical protein